MIVLLLGCVTFPFRVTSARVGGIYTTLSSLVLIFLPFGAELILPSLMVSLAEAQVLPTDGANCRVIIRGPGPTGMVFWPKEPKTMNL